MLWVLRNLGSAHSTEDNNGKPNNHGRVVLKIWTMKRSRRRYIVFTIIFTSIFWLAVEFVLLAYSNNLSIEILEQPFYGGKLRDDSDKIFFENKNKGRSFEDSEPDQEKTIMSIAEFKSSYVSILPVKPRGAGENGAEVKNDDSEAEVEKIGYKKYSFNELSSSKISLERSIPDNRDTECFAKKYPRNLPSASVIVIFHNEAWSTLLRTVHTVLARSPPFLLKEIILVDDFSNYEDYGHLKDKLQRYITQFKKVHLIRAKERQGLIRARLIGAKHATGDVLVFLDSHCEANFGWLEPLLARIAVDSSIVVTPDIEVIDLRTFAYSKAKESNNRGVFNWELTFKWRALPDYEVNRRLSSADPIRSPTMAGGLFAIDKAYFYKIGSYDTEMSYWGGENVEISFRIWMCGGSLEIIPCSKVGHVFRESQPYKIADGAIDVNNMRLAEVWMDEYKKIFYAMRPQLKGKQFGDISERLALRRKLKCKSFEWYLKNIIPELEIPDLYPPGRGDVRNLGAGRCLDTLGKNDVGGEPGMYMCHGQGNNQFFMYTKKDEIWHDDLCLDLTGEKSKVKLYGCHGEKGNQQWIHTKDGPIRHAVHNVCLDVDGSKAIVAKICDGSNTQNWRFYSYPLEEKKKKSGVLL